MGQGYEAVNGSWRPRLTRKVALNAGKYYGNSLHPHLTSRYRGDGEVVESSSRYRPSNLLKK